jgi:hypothetical protein
MPARCHAAAPRASGCSGPLRPLARSARPGRATLPQARGARLELSSALRRDGVTPLTGGRRVAPASAAPILSQDTHGINARCAPRRQPRGGERDADEQQCDGPERERIGCAYLEEL